MECPGVAKPNTIARLAVQDVALQSKFCSLIVAGILVYKGAVLELGT